MMMEWKSKMSEKWLKMSILLDFSWLNERKCLILQAKVDYNILL